MSESISSLTVGQKPDKARQGVRGHNGTGNARKAVLAPMQAFLCGNPLCSETVTPTRRWHRFCSDGCLQKASLIRRAGELLKDLSDDEVLRVIRG